MAPDQSVPQIAVTTNPAHTKTTKTRQCHSLAWMLWKKTNRINLCQWFSDHRGRFARNFPTKPDQSVPRIAFTIVPAHTKSTKQHSAIPLLDCYERKAIELTCVSDSWIILVIKLKSTIRSPNKTESHDLKFIPCIFLLTQNDMEPSL